YCRGHRGSAADRLRGAGGADTAAGGRLMAALASATPLVSLRGISKRYTSVLANDAIDLDVGEGEIHALLGENGAGKSTLVKIIFGVTQPDAGRIFWRGQPAV